MSESVAAQLPKFTPLGPQHLLAVAVVLAVITALTLFGRRLPVEGRERLGRIIGAVLLGYYLVESLVRVGSLGMRVSDTLPFELCSALFFIGAYAYWTQKPWAFDIIYFWTFAGTLHSLVTPTPRAGFPDLNYFQYFTAHGLLVLSAVYSVAVLRRVPARGSLWRAYLGLQAFTVLVAIIDYFSGMNYLYLRAKPPSPTMLDAFGEWPWYLVGGETVALFSFTLWGLPFFIARRRRAVTSPAAGGEST
jgi:hypothetical integral membrane protein (TIGR02206 family)